MGSEMCIRDRIRVEVAGEVCVVSGDYKTDSDATCAPFEPVRCHTFVTESTFGLPIYRWAPRSETFADINAWWRKNRDEGRASVLCGYSLGKAQRLISGLDAGIGPIFTHGAVERFCADYRAEGVALPPTTPVWSTPPKMKFEGAMIVGPPSVAGTPWLKRFGDFRMAFASGWMQIRGTRRRKAVDRGFALSDHADWAGLNAVIDASGAEEVWLTHGSTGAMTRWLVERGVNAKPIVTRFEGETETEPMVADEPEA